MKKRKSYFKRGNLLIYLLVGYAFFYLHQYRYNDPLPVGSTVNNFELTTLSDKSFHLTDINIPKAIVFFDHTNIYSPYYLKILPELSVLNKSGKLYVLAFSIEKDKNEILELFQKKKYKVLENMLYLTHIDKLADDMGVRSWPHFFMLDHQNEIIYEAKLPSMREVQDFIRSQ